MSLWTSVLEFPINHNSSYPIDCATEFLSSQEERKCQQHVATLNVESGGGRPFTVRSQPKQVALHVLFHFTEEQPVWEKKKKKKDICTTSISHCILNSLVLPLGVKMLRGEDRCACAPLLNACGFPWSISRTLVLLCVH